MDLYRTKHWHEFRDKVMRRDGGVCVRCRRGPSSDVVLQVHHRRYEAGRRPWEYPYDACETLCRGCHAAEHGLIAPKFGWDFLGYEDLGDVIGNCDLCGTAIRYVFLVHHAHWPAMEVGETCCDHLTSTQVASNHMESVRRFVDRQNRFISSSRWATTPDGAFAIKQAGIDLRIESSGNRKYRLRMNGVLGRKLFDTVETAKKEAFELIESGVVEKYLATCKKAAGAVKR